jgi:multiple sugar transport system substrate-binding protein
MRFLATIVIAIALTACSSGGGTPKSAETAGGAGTANGAEAAKPANPSPVTLTIFATLDPLFFKNMGLEELLKAKYPHITLKFVQINNTTVTFENALSSGETPDLVCCSIASIGQFKDLKLISDMTPYIQKTKFDLGTLNPGMEQVIRSYSEKGEFIMMPFYMSTAALYYNKDLFDKFAVPYPTDGMTWEAVYELTKRLTRQDGGVQYKGFLFNQQNITYKNQLALAFVDPKTNKAAVNTDGWKTWLETMASFGRIEGNFGGSEQDLFLKERTLAMRTGATIIPLLPDATQKGLNWDVVSYPDFSGKKGAGTQMNAPYFAITPQSKNKDAAFQFLSFLVSEDSQTQLSAKGNVPVIRSPKAAAAFGSTFPELKGKNLTAFMKDTIAAPAPYTRYDDIARTSMYKKLTEVQQTGKDANTALREVEEEVNKKIAEQIALGK